MLDSKTPVNGIVIFAILSILSSLCAGVSAKTYYISNSGSDSYSGTKSDSAWKSLDKVYSMRLSINPGDSLLFRRGDTFRGDLTFSRNGTIAAPIVLSAYGTGARPVISGSRVISNWVLYSGTIYKAQCDTPITHLFVNGVQQTIARYPNKGFMKIEATNGTTTITSSSLSGVPGDAAGATAHIRIQYDAFDRKPVQLKTGTTLTLDSAVTVNPMSPQWGFYLDNKLEFIDSSNEWSYDKSSKTAYLQLPGGINPNTVLVEGSCKQNGFWLGWNNEYVSIENLAFHQQINISVSGSNQHNIMVRNCEFADINKCGLRFDGGSTDCWVDSCSFSDINSSAIASHRIRNFRITNSTFRRISLIPGYEEPCLTCGQAIYFISSYGRFSGNRIDSCGYAGLNYFDTANVIEKNVISNTGLSKYDCGSIQTWGTSSTQGIVRKNICYNAYGNLEGTPLEITGGNNLKENHGIYFDDYTNNNLIDSNTVWNAGGGIFVQSSQNITVRHNTSYNCQDAQFSAHEKDPTNYAIRLLSGLKVFGNIFVSLSAEQFCFSEGWERATIEECIYDSNYLYNPYNKFIAERNSSHYTLTTWQGLGYEPNGKQFNTPWSNYRIIDTLSTNLISNGNFNSAITNWAQWTPSTGQAAISWDNTGVLDGGCLKMTVNDAAAGVIQLNSPGFSVENGASYRLKFSVKGTRNGTITFSGRQKTSPYGFLSFGFSFPLETNRNNYEHVFTSKENEPAARIDFSIKGADSTFWIDNISVHKVNAVVDSAVNKMPLFVNMTPIQQTIGLGSIYYRDLDNNPVSGSIILKPYSSKVLIVGQAPTTAQPYRKLYKSDISIKSIKGRFYISGMDSEIGTVHIAGLDGRTIRHISLPVKTGLLGIPRLSAGYYVLRLNTPSTAFARSFVVQNR